MSGYYNNDHYGASGHGVGLPTDTSFTGPWFRISDVSSIGIQAIVPGAGNPNATFGLDVTDDEDAPNRADADIRPGITAAVLTAAQIAQFPAGAGVAINYLFQFDPAPRAKWARWKYTRASGGSATLIMFFGLNTWGARA